MPEVFNYHVIIEQDEDGFFIASCPALPGCHTQGETYEEAIANIKEAIELCLEVAAEDPSYRAKISLTPQPRFIGITELPVQVPAYA